MEFRDIEGFPGYKVSRCAKIVGRRGWILKHSLCSVGYPIVHLYVDGHKRKTCMVHRLVAATWIKNEGNKPQVNHIDGVKTNSDASNLEWVTPSENMKHSFRIGLSGQPPIRRKLDKYAVAWIKVHERKAHNTKYLSEVFGVTRNHIQGILAGRNWTKFS